MDILQLVRGLTANNDTYVGPPGQLTVDQERWELRLHDGETPGGWRICNLNQLNELFMSKDSEFGGVAFAPDDRGYLVRVGNKQYAMRSLVGVNGIEIANPAATEDDSEIGINSSYLNDLLIQGIAGRIAYAVTTGAVAPCTAYTAALPNHWPNSNGSLAAVLFHANAGANATLTVQLATTPSPTALPTLPIKTMKGSVLTAEFVRQGLVGLIMYVDDGTVEVPAPAYRLIGILTPLEQLIHPITGLAALNVQDALAELTARLIALEAGGTPAGGQFYTFANFPQVQAVNSGMGSIPLLDGEYRLVRGDAAGGYRGSGGLYTAFSGHLSLNGFGVDPVIFPTGAVAPDGTMAGTSARAIGIVHRDGTAIFYAPVTGITYSPTARYQYGSAGPAGFVAADAVRVNTQSITPLGAGRWSYSDPGVLVTA